MSFANSWVAAWYSRKILKKERFLTEMEMCVPRKELVEMVESYHIANKWVWRNKINTLLMLKLYFLQQRFNLSDPGMEEEVYDRTSFQKFLDIDLLNDQIPDETTICRFRHLLEANKLQEKMFVIINDILEKKNLLMKQWTIVDATIIKASWSTKNQNKKRDPEMSSTKKWANYTFGMKVHTGVDMKSWLVHSVEYTTASVHDSQVIDELLHGDEEAISADKAYDKKARKQTCRQNNVVYWIINKAVKWKKLSNNQNKHNLKWSKIRSKVEFAYWVVKHLWQHTKVRYRWLLKNWLQYVILMWLANIYRVRKQIFCL